ncbi:MAG: CHAT domain-containing protein [Microbacterium sp.]
MTLSAAELYRRGRAHINAGQNAAARRVLALAAARTDDTDLRAMIAGSLAGVVVRQGDPAAAERLCRDALALPGLSRQTAAVLHGQLGLLALERGDLDDSIAWLDRGIAGIGDDVEHRAPMYLNRSVAHMQAGRIAEGRADLELAIPDYAATGNSLEQAMTVHNSGYAALLEGDLVDALESMGRAYAALSSASAVNAAICALDRAEVLRDAGLVTDAERSLERVAAVFAAHRMRGARGEAQFHLARSLLSHAPDKAARAAAAAARSFRGVDGDWWAIRADAVRLRAELLAQRAGKRSRAPRHEEVVRVAAELDARRLRADAASLRLTWELWDAATPRARRARVRPPRAAPIQIRLLAHEVRAARAAADGTGREVRRHAATGLDELAEWQASFGSLDLATSLVMHGSGLIYAGLGAATRSGRPDVVFEWSERARHLSQQAVPLRPPPDAALAADLAELRQLRSEDGTGEWLSEPRAASLAERVRQRQWSSTGGAGLRRAVTLDELRERLPGDAAYLTYVFDGSGLVVLAVADGVQSIVAIERWPDVVRRMAALRADLDMSASLRSGPIGAAVAASLEDQLTALSAVLVDPIRDLIAGRSIVLTVPNILGGLPWGMLPALRGQVFTIATSATQWLADQGPVTTYGSVGFVVGPGVARGAEEVATARSAWRDAETLDGAAASVDAVTALATRVDLLHIAAHGRHAADHPLFSGIELADGTIFGYDIDLVPEVPETVVLSACEVGRSTVRGGEEAVGMTRVWLHAGARCVIAAPVIVADDIACELLGAMHEDLAAGAAPAAALAAASARTGLFAPFQAHGAGF